MEHDSTCVFMEKDCSTWPLPLGVMVVDSAVRLFGKVFPFLGDKHKLQLLSHFNETIKTGICSSQVLVSLERCILLNLYFSLATDANKNDKLY